jgi:hypothetical protein
MKQYVVTNQDVDGTYTRKFKTFTRAEKHFVDMCGYTLKQVFSFYDMPNEFKGYARMVSNYGNVVTLQEVEV